VMLVVIVAEKAPGNQLDHNIVGLLLHLPLVFEARVTKSPLRR
jgi:hypothetical protein